MKIRSGFIFLILVTAIFIVGCELSEPDHVYIYAVTTYPTTSQEIILKNPTLAAVNLTGWTLNKYVFPTVYTFPFGSVIYAGAYLGRTPFSLGFDLDSGGTIYLKDDSGQTVDTW